VYEGSSGGPIVENNKVVGIIVNQGIDNEGKTAKNNMLEFAYAIKGKYIIELLHKQIEKDKRSSLK
jgi:hypothetical protein